MLRYVNRFLAVIAATILTMLGILIAPAITHYIHFRLDVTLGNLISIASIGAGLWKTNDSSKKRSSDLKARMDMRLNAIDLKLTPVQGKPPVPISARNVPFPSDPFEKK